jgi:hypothetical protein
MRVPSLSLVTALILELFVDVFLKRELSDELVEPLGCI